MHILLCGVKGGHPAALSAGIVQTNERVPLAQAKRYFRRQLYKYAVGLDRVQQLYLIHVFDTLCQKVSHVVGTGGQRSPKFSFQQGAKLSG